MKNLKKLVFLSAGVCGLSTFSFAGPNPVRAQLVDYFLGTDSVGVDMSLVNSGVTGTFQFSSLGRPSNFQNFQVFQSFSTTESYNAATGTVTANYLTSNSSGSVTYDYESAATTAPGNILTPKTSSAGSYAEFTPTDTIFTPAGTQYTAEVAMLGNLSSGVGVGHYQASAAPGVTTSVIDNGTTTTLVFTDLNTPYKFNPDIDVKLYNSAPVPDPAVYMGMGFGLLGFCVRKRRVAAKA